jgi:hypothetical protein
MGPILVKVETLILNGYCKRLGYNSALGQYPENNIAVIFQGCVPANIGQLKIIILSPYCVSLHTALDQYLETILE